MLLISVTLISCSVFKDSALSIRPTSFYGFNFKTSGYFYRSFKSDVPRVEIFFFYKNGVVLYGEAPSKSQLEFHEESFKDGSFHDRVKERKIGWGAFSVDASQNKIQFETWGPSSGGLYEQL